MFTRYYETTTPHTLTLHPVTALPPKGLGAGKGNVVHFRKLNQNDEIGMPRTTSGLGEFDRVCGGGLEEGSIILIGGNPGIGKSTI